MNDKKKRVTLAWLLAIAAFIGFLIIWDCENQVFYLTQADSPDDLWRFAWMIPSTLLGLAARAYRLREEPGAPWGSYARYFLYLMPVNFIFFALCHSTLNLKTWLFYPISAMAALAFTFPDELPRKLESYVNKFIKVDDAPKT